MIYLAAIILLCLFPWVVMGLGYLYSLLNDPIPYDDPPK